MGKAAKVLLLCRWLHVSAEDEALLFRLRGDMGLFYAELRHRHWRLSLEAASKVQSVGPADASSVANWASWLRGCADKSCSCNALPETGRVDERCNCPLLPSSTGQLGRTLRLGRVLWCVASTVSVAADFYAHTGGSASLMAHGMAVKPGRSHQALLWTWEAQRNWALEATKNLQAAGADAVLVTPPAWEGAAAQEALLEEAKSGNGEAAVRAVVVAEAPPFPHATDRGDGTASEVLLQAPCMNGSGIEFVFIDPLEAFVPEFSVLFQSCPGLKWIAVHNTNLREMAGWIPRFLANQSAWHLVLKGSHLWRPVELARHVPRRREWQLWARGDALIQAPPELEELVKSTWQAWRSWGVDLEEKGPKRGEESVKSRCLPAAVSLPLRLPLAFVLDQSTVDSRGKHVHSLSCGASCAPTKPVYPLAATYFTCPVKALNLGDFGIHVQPGKLQIKAVEELPFKWRIPNLPADRRLKCRPKPDLDEAAEQNFTTLEMIIPPHQELAAQALPMKKGSWFKTGDPRARNPPNFSLQPNLQEPAMMPEVLNILKSLHDSTMSAKVRLVRRPGFQFGGGLHQRKRGIANKTVTGKNLLRREKTLRRNKGGRTYADESMPPSKKG
ncbi:unnamed protein product [Cladocopium goreaui]|uniref:Uncharacterized protein n=1 Tax=Cladocopium goreaui TaxID=2562237 RepID=A0A9P1FQB9_9DINO|nr:unnamed protein product [Cladocopium goreaui]